MTQSWRRWCAAAAISSLLVPLACSLDAAGEATDGQDAGGLDATAADVTRGHPGHDSGNDVTTHDPSSQEASAAGDTSTRDATRPRDSSGSSDRSDDTKPDTSMVLDTGTPKDTGSDRTDHDSCSSYCSLPTLVVPIGNRDQECLDGGCGSTDLSCPTGEVMVGVDGTLQTYTFDGGSSTYWTTLAAECAKVRIGSPTALAVTYVQPAPASDGGTVALCPQGSVMVGFKANYSGAQDMHNLTLACRAIAVDYTAPDVYTVVVGSTLESVDAGGSANSSSDIVKCPPGEVAVSFYVSTVTVTFSNGTTTQRPWPEGLTCRTVVAQ